MYLKLLICVSLKQPYIWLIRKLYYWTILMTVSLIRVSKHVTLYWKLSTLATMITNSMDQSSKLMGLKLIVCDWSLSLARWIQFRPSCSISLSSTLMLSSLICLGLANSLLLFFPQNCSVFLSCLCYMPHFSPSAFIIKVILGDLYKSWQL